MMNYRSSRIRVLVLETQAHSARAYYRSRGAFPYFPDNYEFTYFNRGQAFSRFEVMQFDAFFFGGMYDDVAVKLAEWAKEQGKIVITDYDDDLFSVTPENQTYNVFSNPKTNSNIRALLGMSDLCFVTVEGLKKVYSKYCNNVVVVPNCINDYIIDLELSKHSDTKFVLWRGGTSHAHEVDMVSEQWISLMKKYSDWKFIFKGYNPYKITTAVNNAIVLDTSDLFDYFVYLQNCAVSTVFIPLRNGVFNDSKSNIGWQDATLAGASAVVPSYGGQWHGEPYAFSYSKIEEAVDVLELAMKNAKDDSLFMNSRRLIYDKYLLSEWNVFRVKEIEKVMNNA